MTKHILNRVGLPVKIKATGQIGTIKEVDWDGNDTYGVEIKGQDKLTWRHAFELEQLPIRGNNFSLILGG